MKDPPNKEILFFSASHCNACKLLEPILERLSDDGYRVNKNMQYDDFKAYDVQFVPALVVLQETKEVFRTNGIPQYDELKEILQYDQCILPKEKDIF